MAAGPPVEPQPGPSGEAADFIVDLDISLQVSKSIGKMWKFLGRRMGLEEQKLVAIEIDCAAKGIEEMAYQMLLFWKQEMPQRATVKVLAQHLRDENRKDLALNILKMAKKSKASSSSNINVEGGLLPGARPSPSIQASGGIGSMTSGPGDSGCHHHEAPTQPQPVPKEDMERIWESLKATLKCEQEKLQIPRMPWLGKWELGLADYYVELTIVSKTDKKRHDLQLHKIFKSCEEKKPARILIEGPAGYGKTTLAHKLCFDHSKDKEYIKDFEVVILLRLREFEGTLNEQISKTLQIVDYKPEHVLETITINQSKVLFILDGLDELDHSKHGHIFPLLRGKQLPKATVIVTSRLEDIQIKNVTSDESITNLVHCMDSRIEIKGMTQQNRTQFLKLYLKEHPIEKLTSTIIMVENKFGLTSGQQDNNLFKCPLFLLLLVIVIEESAIGLDAVASTTELYKTLFNFILRRALLKKGQADDKRDFFEFDSDEPPDYVQRLSKFGSFALQAMNKRNYAFDEKEIDNTILELGILTQNGAKEGKSRKTWYEPLHLSFLEFSIAYHVWFNLIRASKVACFVFLRDVSILLKSQNLTLVAPFLIGLCRMQLQMLCSVLAYTQVDWLKDFTSPHSTVVSESQLNASDLANVFLPLVPAKYEVPDSHWNPTSLLKETLTNALNKNQLKNIFHSQKFSPEQAITPQKLRSSHLPSNDEIIPNHRLTIVNQYETTHFNFTLRLCKASVEQQANWLSDWIVLEGFNEHHKPIHEIQYGCSERAFLGVFHKITELIQNERIESLKIVVKKFDFIPPFDLWCDFLYFINSSKKLLDMSLTADTQNPLFIDLGSVEGKRWRRIEFVGNVVPCLGSFVVSCTEHFETDLNNFIKEIPSRVQTLCMQLCLSGYIPNYVFVQAIDSFELHNLRELFITFSDKSSLELSSWDHLSSLQVLAIAFSNNFKTDMHKVINIILSILSHCKRLKRLELWHGCTEDFAVALLQHLAKGKCLAMKNQEQKFPSRNIQLDTLMLSHVVSYRDSTFISTTAKTLKELLLSGCLKNLWLSCNKHADGFAKSEFINSFSPKDGFKSDLIDEPVQEHLWWQRYHGFKEPLLAIVQLCAQ